MSPSRALQFDLDLPLGSCSAPKRSLLLTAGFGFFAQRLKGGDWAVNIGPHHALGDLPTWTEVEDFVWAYLDEDDPAIRPRTESEFCRYDGALG